MGELRGKQVNFRTPDEVYFRAKTRADDLGFTMSSYLNHLVMEDLGFSDDGVLNGDRDVLLEILKTMKDVEKRLEALELK